MKQKGVIVNEKVTRITTDKLMTLMGSDKKFHLVDVLPAESYEKEHIKGAISIPLSELRDKAEILLKKDELVVVYCASFDCKASTTAAKLLREMDFKNVLDYKGGLKDYKETRFPLEGTLHGQETNTCTACA
jgi:rhodanese-related sulfurtransferase